MNFVFTGPVRIGDTHHTREEMIKLAEMYGHRVQKSVSYQTNYLICTDHTTTKAKKAIKCGVKIITPEHFMNMIFTL